MNKNQTAREIIEGLDEIASEADAAICGLPCGNEEWYAKMEALVLSKLDHGHLPGDGEPGTLQEVLTNLTKNDSEKEKEELSRYDKIPFIEADPLVKEVEECRQEVERALSVYYQNKPNPKVRANLTMYRFIKGITANLTPENERLKEEVKAWSISLQSLTPGGSEFMDDPQRCVQVARDIHNSQHKFIVEQARQIRELKEQNAGLRDENKLAMNRVRELEREVEKLQFEVRLKTEAAMGWLTRATKEPIPTLSDDELKLKAQEIAWIRFSHRWVLDRGPIEMEAIYSAMIEMYKLK